MSELRQTIATNIKILRLQSGMTQAEYAQKLNYTDKSVSKWERGDGLPDIIVLKQIADMHGVSVDWLLSENGAAPEETPKPPRLMNRTQKIIVLLSIIGTYFVAVLAFVIGWIVNTTLWNVFVFCIPVCFILLIVFNSIWGRHWITFYYISCLIWTLILSIYVAALPKNLWLIFIVGIPLQLATVAAYGFIPRKKK